jgi:hypothetical protein
MLVYKQKSDQVDLELNLYPRTTLISTRETVEEIKERECDIFV